MSKKPINKTHCSPITRAIRTIKKTLLSFTATTSIIIATSSFAHPGFANQNLPEIIKQVGPSVVNLLVEKQTIETANPAASGRHHKPQLENLVTGSGVIINSKKGYIITNAHVIKDNKFIIVTLKNTSRYVAKVIGEADDFDLAVIQIKASGLHAIKSANSNLLEIGQPVAAIGSPFGLRGSVTAGIISGLNRDSPSIENIQNFVQTDAPINPGNSGGPLINGKGEMIGINTALYAPLPANVGIGFAIPSNMAMAAAKQLIQFGKIKKGMLGVMIQNIDPNLAQALNLPAAHQGVVVTQVLKESPAENAGLQVEDIITAVNKIKVNTAIQLHNQLALSRPKTIITLDILRKGSKRKIHVKVGDPLLAKMKIIPILAGLRSQDFSLLQPDGETLQGVIVLAVTPTSPALLAGLIPGDVILKADGTPTPNTQSLMLQIKRHPHRLLLTVNRAGGRIFLVITA